MAAQPVKIGCAAIAFVNTRAGRKRVDGKSNLAI